MNNVIVSPHFLSTDIGSKIFKQGGNAVDAAITTNLIQGIVAPETCGIGGDLFAIVWDPEKTKPTFLDASGYAGSGVNPKKLLGLDSIPLNHPYSVTVPGAVKGWHELNKRYGSIPMEEAWISSLVIVSEEAIFSKLWKLAVTDSLSPKKTFISITFHGTDLEKLPLLLRILKNFMSACLWRIHIRVI